MTSANTETIEILSDATAMVYRPDGLQVAVATLNGQITFFNPVTGQQTGNIDGRGDLAVGRSDTDLVTPKKSKAFFTAMSYSADGEFILGMVSHKMSLITIFWSQLQKSKISSKTFYNYHRLSRKNHNDL